MAGVRFKSKRMAKLIEIARSVQTQWLSEVTKSSLRSLSPWFQLSNVIFHGVDDKIKRFTCSQDPSKLLLAVIEDRQIHVYYGKNNSN